MRVDPNWQATGLASLAFFSAVGYWIRSMIARADARRDRRR